MHESLIQIICFNYLDEDKTFLVVQRKIERTFHVFKMYHLNVIEDQDQEDTEEYGPEYRYNSYHRIFTEIDVIQFKNFINLYYQ